MSTPDHASNLAREDVHKSCKSLETVVNLLNGYCEATNAIVLLQRKLAKAIRDTASMKASPAVANNTLNVTAAIFEMISEVNGKFAKIADKECDNLNDDVKKWFRKLAKEERMHDEKIASASARIKQAGQAYEKKVKKNARDVAEEHTRYIQLLSSLGSEMSQEKFNHSSLVAQKQAAVTCRVSSAIARVADAEWTRCCESVRKSSPKIGSLGEWRSFCDSGWTGNIPDDLPDNNGPVATGPPLAAFLSAEEDLNSDTDMGTNRTTQADTRKDHTPPNSHPALPPLAASPDPEKHDLATMNSDIPALDNFPAPPLHFPLPHLRGAIKSPLDGGAGNPPLYGRQIASLVLPNKEAPNSTPATPQELGTTTTTHTKPPAMDVTPETSTYFPVMSRSDAHQHLSLTDPSTVALTAENTEFGVRRHQPLTPSGSSGSPSLPRGSPRSSGVVLAMRNRFSQNSISSGLSREATTSIPRLPVSVSTIAGRYQLGSEHPPVRSDRHEAGTNFESIPNNATGADASGTNTDFQKTGKEPPSEERGVGWVSKGLEFEPQRLARSTSAQAEYSMGHRDGHSQPTSTRETTGLRVDVSTRCESLQQESTRSPSLVNSRTSPYVGSPDSPRENLRVAKPRGWIRRLSMPILSSLDGSKKPDSPVSSDLPQAQWGSSLALPETKRHRKMSLDTLGDKFSQRR